MSGLPDLLVWGTELAGMAYWYRRRAGEILVRDLEEPQSARNLGLAA